MTDSLSTIEIKKRSLSGAKWLVVMNGLGMPAAFLIALMLGRVGPEALGTYALAQILIGVITTFVVYGGPPVLSVFMPKLASAEDRGRFVFSYLTILLAGMTIVLALFWLFPRVLEFLLQRDFDMRKYGWFVLLAGAVVATETFANAASGLMLIKVSAIARQMMRLILLPLVAVLFLTRRDWLAAHPMPIIVGGFLTGYLIAAVISLLGISRDKRFSLRPGWLLPPGFWAFSLSTMAATIFSFLYGNFDRMAVLSIQDVKGLGMYQAVLSITMFISLVPRMFGGAIVPTFSTLLAAGRMNSLRNAYTMVQGTGAIMMTLTSLLLISYSKELLGLFGRSYVSYHYLLAIFCVKAVITSPHFGNTPILMAYEKNSFRFTVNLLQILLQVIGTLIFIGSFGVLAIALSKVVGAILAQTTSIVYISYWMRKDFALPRTYRAGVIVALSSAIIRNASLPAGWGMSSAAFLVSAVIFFVLSGINIAEIQHLFRYAFYRPERIT